MKKAFIYKFISICVCAFLLLSPAARMMSSGNLYVHAENVLLLSQAKALAVSGSREYKRLKSKITLQRVKYTEAVRTIQLKKKNMSTFRWTPLLNFKFPTKPDLAAAYEFTYKPLSIQAEISALEHQLSDQIYAVYEEVSNLYTQTYTLQERIAFEEKQLENMREVLNRNRARLFLGEASQSDIDTMERSISVLLQTIASDMRAFEGCKQKLSELISVDVSSGYSFRDPYVDFQVERRYLNALVDYTLEHSQSCFEARLTSQLALISLNTNYSLMASQYGSKMEVIDPFIARVKRGEGLDTQTFKSAYDHLLVDVDSPWQGKKRILFIKIPKEWFKGDIDGVRYVEDEPYALYTAALDYEEALKDQQDTEKEVESQVRDGFEALVTAENSYLSLKEQVSLAEKNLERAGYLNALGELTYEEYKAIEDEYREYQIDALESLDFYTQSLYSFDRLTCGGITAVMNGNFFALTAVAGGSSYLTEEIVEGASYYIQSKVEDQVFDLGIYLPDDYDIEITDFELWCDGIRIGERTAADKTLRHLTLAVDSVEQVFIRLYNDGEFVDDCEIDPREYIGKLSVTGGYTINRKETRRAVADYHYQNNAVTGIAVLTLETYVSEEIGYYTIEDGSGNRLFSDELVPAARPFSYLAILLADLESVTVKFYDEAQGFLYDAYFDTESMTVFTRTEQ